MNIDYTLNIFERYETIKVDVFLICKYISR